MSTFLAHTRATMVMIVTLIASYVVVEMIRFGGSPDLEAIGWGALTAASVPLLKYLSWLQSRYGTVTETVTETTTVKTETKTVETPPPDS